MVGVLNNPAQNGETKGMDLWIEYLKAAEDIKPIEVNAELAEKNKFCPICGLEEKMEDLSVIYRYLGKEVFFLQSWLHEGV